MVQQCSELLLLVPGGLLPAPVRVLVHTQSGSGSGVCDPRPSSSWSNAFPPCPPPKRLRFPLHSFVRALCWYYSFVRLPSRVHVGLEVYGLHPPARFLLWPRALLGPPGSRA